MIYMALYKHLNCAVDQTIDNGHMFGFNTNYRIYGVSIWCNGLGVSLWKHSHIERYVPTSLE